MVESFEEVFKNIDFLINENKVDQAIDLLSNAVQVFYGTMESFNLATLYIKIMIYYENRNPKDTDNAILNVKSTIMILENIIYPTESVRFFLAKANIKLGQLLCDKRCYHESIKAYTNGCDIFEALLNNVPTNDQYISEASSAEMNIAIPYSLIGEFEKASLRFSNALKIKYQLLEKYPNNETCISEVADIQYNLGQFYLDRGNYNSAFIHYIEALKMYCNLFSSCDNKLLHLTSILETSLGLSALFRETGEFEKGENICIKALEIIENSNCVKDNNLKYYTAMVQDNLGIIYKDQNLFEKAEKWYRKSIRLYKELVDSSPHNIKYMISYATACNNNGIRLAENGIFVKANKNYLIALKIRKELMEKYPEELNRKIETATTMNNLGNLCLHRNNLRSAKKWHQQALELYRQIAFKDKDNPAYRFYVATVENNLGNVLNNENKLDKAEKLYKSALNTRKSLYETDKDNLRYSSDLASSYFNLGTILFTKNEFDEAISLFNCATYYATKSHDSYTLTKVNQAVGKCYLKMGKLTKARKMFKKSIEQVENIRNQFSLEDNKINILWDKTSVYDDIISLCIEMNDIDAAWEYVEMVKARSLLDFLKLKDISSPDALSEDLKLKEMKILGELRAYDIKMRKTNSIDKLSLLMEEFSKKKGELNKLYDDLEKLVPEYVDLRRGKSLTMKSIKSLLRRMEGNRAFVEYYITTNKVFVFIMKTQDTKPMVKQIDIDTNLILQSLNKYDSEVVHYYAMEGIKETWYEKIVCIVKPVLDEVKGCKIAYFVLHKLLHYIPFHAILIDGNRLIEYIPVAFTPSLSVLIYSQGDESEPKSCLSIGYTKNENEREDFEGEAEIVAKIYKSEPHIGIKATSSLLRNVTEDLVHISCHAKFDVSKPLNSGLQLFDGLLTVGKIFGMKINTYLIVLSACETGMNKYMYGDEMIGLTRSMLYAGARSLIVSLWRVDGLSTRIFMEHVHHHIKKYGFEGISIEKAIQQAQIEMLKSNYRHPYYWAPFIVIR